VSLERQVMILYAAINGYLDDIPVDKVTTFEVDFYRFVGANHPKVGEAIAKKKEISSETEEELKKAIAEFKKTNYPVDKKEAKEEKEETAGAD
jgi:F-type H+-transporting ATPase subunit alpha